jgi:hypothetical protein
MKNIACVTLLLVFVVTIGLNTSTYAQGPSARDRWVASEIRREQQEARQNELNRERQRQEQSERDRERWVASEVRREQQEARQNELNREQQRREQSERERDRWVNSEIRREQYEARQNELNRERQQPPFQNGGNNWTENNPRQGGILTPQGNPTLRLEYQGTYDGRPQRQAVGGMILSRWERTIYLPSGDRIPLPWDALWSGNARVSVEQASDSRQLLYDVTIRTRGGEPLDSRIVSFLEEYGPEAALEAGLAFFGPEAPMAHRAMTGALVLMRATPTPDGEAVQWNNVRSAFGGRTVVRIIREP